METNGKYMVKIKILNNNSNNEATVNQKAINPFFQQRSSEKQQATPSLDLAASRLVKMLNE